MTFLNPLVLFGLVAASIPLILHLLTIRKLRTIEFSTLNFLKELQQTKIRRLKLRQIILLLIRTLIIISIVIAFARPALRGTIFGSIGTNANSTVVIIFDDSFSMIANDENGELFKQAKDATGKLLDLLKEGDEVYLIKLSDLPKATVDPATHDFSVLRTIINESQVSFIHRSVSDALRLSAKFLSQTMNANKEIYIISDFQKTHFKKLSQERGHESLSLFDERVKIFNIQLGKKEISNVSIDSVEVKTKILEKDKSAKINVTVRNFGDVPLKNYVVSIYFDNARVAQSNVNIEPLGTTSIEFAAAPKRTGFIECYAELESDNIEQDNRRYFNLYIPEKINVEVVSNSKEDIKYILLALPKFSNEAKRSLFEIRQITQPNFYRLDLKKINVLIFTNIKSFSHNEVERIKGFVEQGGGVIFFPGQDIQKENYNTTILPALNISTIDDIVENASSSSGFSFDKIDLDHPLFETVFEKEQDKKSQKTLSFESPNIYKTLKRASGKQARTVISLSNGEAFISEHEIGSGKILFYSVPPNMTWSNFPLKGIFAPLIYRSVIYVASQTKTQTSFICGDEPIISIRSDMYSGNEKKYRMILPDGTEELITANSQFASKQSIGSQLILKPDQVLKLPGFYLINADKSLISLISVNVDRFESDCRRISLEDLDKFWKWFGIQSSSVQSPERIEYLQSAVLQSRFGIELWKYFVGIALLLALLEMLIARDSRKSNQQISE